MAAPSGPFRSDLDRALADANAIGAAALRDLGMLAPPAEDEEMTAAALDAIDRMVTRLDQRVSDQYLSAGTDSNRADQIREYESGYTDPAVAAGPVGLTERQASL